MVIKNEYYFYDDLNDLNSVGLYDMIIKYSNKENNISETIIIEDFLEVTR